MARRICHISTVHPTFDVRIFHRECRGLARAGYDVHLVIQAERDETVDGVRVHALPRRSSRLSRMLIAPWGAMRRALRARAELFHLHDPELLPVGFLLRWLWRKPVIFDVHESIAEQMLSKEWLPRWSRPLVGLAYRAVERCLRPGLCLVLANESSAAHYPAHAVVVRNFPDAAAADLGEVQPVSRRPRPPLLLYVGAVTEDRGALLYPRMLRGLLDRGCDARLQIVGPAEPRLAQRLTAEIARLNLSDRAAYLGPLPFAQAMNLAAEATLGLCLLMPMPNYTTCLATKILEYMMCGTPVLASAFDHWRPYVEGVASGRMANPLNEAHVIETARAMLSDAAALDAMGDAGRRAGRERFNWSSEFTALTALYEDMLAAR